MAQQRTRFAVVGLGHIAQVAVLPAFANATNCELAALVSRDALKLKELAERYDVARAVDYDEYDALLESGDVDAVYIAVPNHLHAEYTVRAARRGIHVLCEKPMAPSVEECEAMICACREAGVGLMIAYRLHFEHINLAVAEMIQQGAIGEPRLFSSVFCQDVKHGDIRLESLDKGGGTVFDMGVYCINAARYLFRSEPTRVVAQSTRGRDDRFRACDEMTSVVLSFPGGACAQFTSSFGATRTGDYRIVGTEGEIVVHNAYDYAKEMWFELIPSSGQRRRERASKRDQFGAQLTYFARCIQSGQDPEPNGSEGLADVRIIAAIHESAKRQSLVQLELSPRSRRPGLEQAIWLPGIGDKPEEIHASGPSD